MEIIVAAVAATLGSLGSLFSAWWSRREAAETNDLAGLDIQQRIEQLQGHLNSSAALMAEIQAEFRLQEASLERIKTDAERNQRLAALHQAEADAVRAVIEEAQSRGLRLGNRAQWGFFVAGLLSSIPLGIVVNFLYDLMTS